jgi:transcription initiation factor TFIIIB Brf1 subunit/transcription initiation factor TFIIB
MECPNCGPSGLIVVLVNGVRSCAQCGIIPEAEVARVGLTVRDPEIGTGGGGGGIEQDLGLGIVPETEQEKRDRQEIVPRGTKAPSGRKGGLK